MPSEAECRSRKMMLERKDLVLHMAYNHRNFVLGKVGTQAELDAWNALPDEEREKWCAEVWAECEKFWAATDEERAVQSALTFHRQLAINDAALAVLEAEARR